MPNLNGFTPNFSSIARPVLSAGAHSFQYTPPTFLSSGITFELYLFHPISQNQQKGHLVKLEGEFRSLLHLCHFKNWLPSDTSVGVLRVE